MTLAWGNWDVRVYAADAWVSLAPRFAENNGHIVNMLEKMATDPVPQVRLQIAQNLQVICVAAPDRMWAIAEKIAQEECNGGVLAAFLGRFLHRFCQNDPDRCEAIIEVILNRLSIEFSEELTGREKILEALGSLASQLWVGQERPLACNWLEGWSDEPEEFEDSLRQFLSSLRAALFVRYVENIEPEDIAMCGRAQHSLNCILEKALAKSALYFDKAMNGSLPDEEREAAGQKYKAAEKIIHHAMNQLYFGAGAFKSNEKEKPGLPTNRSKKAFLTDYAQILHSLQNSREPATHHELIELYEFLIPGNPVAVFHALHEILTGTASRDGYQFESLGSGAVVRIVKRYIAEYRSALEDKDARQKLICILQVFSDVGWSEAIELLYELPDLLR